MKNWSINKVGGGGIYQFPLYILLIISLLFILCHVCISTNDNNIYTHMIMIINSEGIRSNILKVGAPKTFIELSTWNRVWPKQDGLSCRSTFIITNNYDFCGAYEIEMEMVGAHMSGGFDN